MEGRAKIHPGLARFALGGGCGLAAVPQGEKIKQWLVESGGSAASILDFDLRTAPSGVFDLSVGSNFFGARPRASITPVLTEKIFHAMKSAGACVGVGRYDEPRLLYTSPLFGATSNPTHERRTVHLGMDFFVEPGAAVRAPLDGVVRVMADNSAPLDYGAVVFLRHETDIGEGFFTLYRPLSKQALSGLTGGQRVARGQQFARVGSTQENGGWTPHLQCQVR